ncbi:MAG TPA: hypothetical protein VLI39_05475 [Sedimentisphaerales bacterium]|nr:hypothetical protein [Sedimentisphaerales bacterium]
MRQRTFPSYPKAFLHVRGPNIRRGVWQDSQTVKAGGILELNSPGKGHWAALVMAR